MNEELGVHRASHVHDLNVLHTNIYKFTVKYMYVDLKGFLT